jgi:hypothetical protein
MSKVKDSLHTHTPDVMTLGNCAGITLAMLRAVVKWMQEGLQD